MSLNKIKQQDATSEQQKTDSKTNYEDCFVYNESRFTGRVIQLRVNITDKNKINKTLKSKFIY